MAEGSLHSPTLTADVLTLLKRVWKFREFCERCFIGMGICSRTLVAAAFLGLENLAEFVKDQRDASNWYLNGFGRYDGNVKHVFAILFLCIFARIGLGHFVC